MTEARTATTELHGHNLIGADRSADTDETFRAASPATGAPLEPAFHEASLDEIQWALEEAETAFEADRSRSPEERARLLERVADEIEALGERLVERVCAETGLGEGRVRGERGRTTGQLRLFAEVVREGSWVEARIDRGDPDREPVPKPDLRRMLIPLGPVAVFGASNFPLAFSVAGGDTASALAAGCPVVCKAHPAHPGTSELVGEAVRAAVAAEGFHPGTFSLLHGLRPEVSLEVVRHPRTQAVGFTGSLQAGRALFDAAAARPHPIPVYAEMGSVNPVFLLPGALAQRRDRIAEDLAGSVTLGAGQFCTNPGLVFGLASESLERFTEAAAQHLREAPIFTMLHTGICSGYRQGLDRLAEAEGVEVVARNDVSGDGAPAGAALFVAEAGAFLENPALGEEVFGPSTLIIRCASERELEAAARALEGQLTATLHGTEADLLRHRGLVEILQRKAGRLIFNGFPTGVEVSPSMHHGGPYPATTDVRATSVGTAAIGRFARPVAFQNFPQEALPPELRDRNERGIWRLVDGEFTREDVGA